HRQGEAAETEAAEDDSCDDNPAIVFHRRTCAFARRRLWARALRGRCFFVGFSFAARAASSCARCACSASTRRATTAPTDSCRLLYDHALESFLRSARRPSRALPVTRIRTVGCCGSISIMPPCGCAAGWTGACLQG